jgi:hypothetical protein
MLLSTLHATATVNWKKSSKLPATTIKKIMRSEETLLSNSSNDYAELETSLSKQSYPTSAQEQQTNFMIAAEAPILMGKACEFMIQELTIRAWYHTEKTNKKILSRCNVHDAVADSDVYDFLIDIIKPTSNSNLDYHQLTLSGRDSSYFYCNPYPHDDGSSLVMQLHTAETSITYSGNTSAADATLSANKVSFDTVIDNNCSISYGTATANLLLDSVPDPLEKKLRIIPPTCVEELNSVDSFLIDRAHESPFE